MTASEVALAYLGAFAGGDPDEIAALVTEDFVNEHHSALGGGCTGRAEYRRRLPGFLGRFAGLRYDAERVVAEGDTVAVTYVMRAIDGDHHVVVHGVMLIDVRDGLVGRRVDYWDSLGYLRQIGAAPVG